MRRVRQSELRWRIWRVRTALLLGGVLVFASCDGSSVSLDDYLQDANAICADAARRLDAAIAPVFASHLPEIGDDPTDEELMGLYAVFVDLESDLRGIPQAMLRNLYSLERPADAEDIVSLWTDIDKRFDDEWALLVAASESAEAARTQLARGSPFEDLNARSLELGLEDCVFN